MAKAENLKQEMNVNNTKTRIPPIVKPARHGGWRTPSFDLTGKHVGDLQFARTWVPEGSYFPSPGEFIFRGIIIGTVLLGVSVKYYRAM